MKTLLLILIFICSIGESLFAQTYVRGYYRSGTYVRPHYRYNHSYRRAYIPKTYRTTYTKTSETSSPIQNEEESTTNQFSIELYGGTPIKGGFFMGFGFSSHNIGVYFDGGSHNLMISNYHSGVDYSSISKTVVLSSEQDYGSKFYNFGFSYKINRLMIRAGVNVNWFDTYTIKYVKYDFEYASDEYSLIQKLTDTQQVVGVDIKLSYVTSKNGFSLFPFIGANGQGINVGLGIGFNED